MAVPESASVAPSSSASFPVLLATAFWTALNTPAVAPATSAAAPPPSTRRREPAPFDSPPYPSAEWILSGSPLIGDPSAGAPYPVVLMDALSATSLGEWLRESRIQIYGWVEAGANVSRSHFNNAPVGYAIRPNQIELDQLALYVERRPDEAQTDRFDWGFRFASCYGLDYRFSTMKGILSEQLLQQDKHGKPAGEIYGYDPVMVYADFYFPWVFEGMNVRVGRFISVPDIEAQLAPDNLMYTHSLLYTFDVFTQIGAIATIRIDANWTIQIGITGGNDIAPWEHRPITVVGFGPTNPGTGIRGNVRVADRGAQPSVTAMIQWISSDQKDCVYFGVNGINDGRFGYNNVQEFPVGVWQHKFNDWIWTITEAWYMFEKGVPGLGYTWECAVVNYTVFRLADSTFLTVRNEYFNDHKGQRTRFHTDYSEHSIGITHWFNKIVTFRPEFRYDHSYHVPAFDNGLRKDQYILAADLIVHY